MAMQDPVFDPEEHETGEFELVFVPGNQDTERDVRTALKNDLGLTFTPTVSFEAKSNRQRRGWFKRLQRGRRVRKAS